MLQQVEKRENWASRFGLLMSLAGMAIGLGNVWRFPYLVGYWGGGAFVLAYLVCLMVIVVPLGIIEAGFGKGIQGGTLDAWTVILKNSKAGKLIGSVFCVGYTTMNFYFMTVLAGTIWFSYAFATDMKSRVDPATMYQYMNTEQTTVLTVIAALILAFVVFVLYKGIQSGIEAVSKVMIPGLFVIFAIIIVFALFFVPNIAEGYNFYLNPDFSVLAQPRMWKEAAGQALFSVGVGPGCILVYGSHIKKDADSNISFVTVALIDTCAALIAGFAMIPTAAALGLDMQSGAGLIFIVLPAALAQIPLGNILGILAMFAVFFAGITSAFAQMEVCVTSFVDGFRMNRKRVILAVGAVTMVFVIWSALSTASFDFRNNFSGNYVFIVTAGLGAIGNNYIFGTRRVLDEYANPGSEVKLGSWFVPLVKYISVPLMIIVMVDSLFPFLP